MAKKSYPLHNYLKDKENWKTKTQWIKEGRLPDADCPGREMRSNGWSTKKTHIYYHKDFTHAASKEELKETMDNIKEEYIGSLEYRKKERTKLLQDATNLPIDTCPNASEIIVFDTETTGLNPYTDEILQLSIIDGDGNVLLDTFCKPFLHSEWPSAQQIHGISPDMVAHAPYLHEIIPQIRGIFASARKWVAYNGKFDLRFLNYAGIELTNETYFDVMHEFASIQAKKRGEYKLQKLSVCAEHYGFEFKAHNALEDARATLFCYKKIIDQNIML